MESLTERNIYESYFGRLLLIDIRNRVVPYSSRRGPISFEWEGIDKEKLTAILGTTVGGRFQSAGDFDEVMEDFLRTCATTMIMNGSIDFTIEKTNQTDVVDAESHGTQIVISTPAHHNKHPIFRGFTSLKRNWGRLMRSDSAKDVPRISFAIEPFFSRQKMIEIFHGLSEVTTIAVPKFVMDDLGETLGAGNFTSGEQNQFRNGRDQLLAITCREIGWFGQTALLGTTTDYHASFRHLRFQMFCTGLREHILSMMNLLASALECVGDQYKTPKLIGSESLKDLREVFEKMREGKINLADVIQL